MDSGQLTFKDCKGEIRSIADLKDLVSNRRWTPIKKSMIVLGVKAGVISKAQAMAWYNLSERELDDWTEQYQLYGVKGCAVGHRVVIERMNLAKSKSE